ncbi:MAG: hypothetical protein KJ042_06770, partial [Deltaproteobacteria bacterium]|nr:hypothetical protein [Deltaproteobacteria bacterium]
PVGPIPLACRRPGGGEAGPLRAGVATGDLYAPIGTSMGGYGSRPGPSHPYAVAMGGSTGYIDRLDVKALALDNGETRLVIARIPAAGASEALYRTVLDRVCEQSGVDLTGRLWLSATHSHSGPSHFLPIPPLLGGTGTDTFDRAFIARSADSIAAVIAASMRALEPAKLDATVVEPFDPDNRFSRDRRCANDPPTYKEDRLFFARVDRADGTPLAAIVSFPSHGVWMGRTVMSADIPGQIEGGLQDTFDVPVEAMFLPGPGGDANPSATPRGQDDEQGMEWHRRTVGPALRDVWDALEPTDDVALGAALRPLSASREAIGYSPGEFGYYEEFTGQFHEYAQGAFYCGSGDVWSELPWLEEHGSIIDCADPSTAMQDGYYGCALPILWIEPWWATTLNEPEVGAFRIGDHVLAFLPGELTAFLSKRLRDGLGAATGLDPDLIATVGYTNGYQGYLLTEWDWLQGGYEASMNYWGPKYGDWLADACVETAAELVLAGSPPIVPEPPLPRYPWPDWLPTGYERAENVGAIVAQPAATYRRFETVSFSWAGAFGGAPSPHVALERETARGFEPMLRADGRALTDASFETVLEDAPDPDYDARRFPSPRTHRMTIRWELTADAPLGRFRWSVTGTNWNGQAMEPYAVASDAFEILHAESLRAEISVTHLGGDDYRIACDGWWPPNPEGYRLRHLDFHANEWSPVAPGSATATIAVDGGTTETIALAPTADGHFDATFTMTQHGHAHTARVLAGDLADAYGNTNGEDSNAAEFGE